MFISVNTNYNLINLIIEISIYNTVLRFYPKQVHVQTITRVWDEFLLNTIFQLQCAKLYNNSRFSLKWSIFKIFVLLCLI